MAKQDYLMNRKILFQLDYIKQVCIVNNISLVVEFYRWWVLKSKIFGQKSKYSKEIVVFCQ